MRYTAMALVVASTLLGSAASNAAMNKVRTWPSGVTAPTAALQEQYEYDPAAGAASNKLIRYRTEMKSYVSEVRYRDGMPVGGNLEGVGAYHGFTAILNTASVSTQVLKYKEQDKWPASAFNIYEENKMGRLGSKNILKCQRLGTLEAKDVISPLMPGKLIKYDCKYSSVTSGEVNGSKVDDSLWEYSYVGYYSDYLDLVLARQQQGYSEATTTLEFIDAGGTLRTVTFSAEGEGFP